MALIVVMATPTARADSLWARVDPSTAFMFQSYKAHRVGDLVTIALDENTQLQAIETRQMNKATTSTAGINATGSGGAGQATSSITGALTGNGNSGRTFNGQNNSSIDRTFTDRMSAVVTAILPNGNMVIEGYRQRMVQREIRVLHITGIIRPGDIGPYNIIQSQYIANFSVTYQGRGPESSFTSHGVLGRFLNLVWPF